MYNVVGGFRKWLCKEKGGVHIDSEVLCESH